MISKHLRAPAAAVCRLLRVRLERESGQALVLTAIMLIPMLGLAALAIDIGYLFQVRTHLQRMADASAHAAVQRLPIESQMVATALEYAQKNDVNGAVIVIAKDVTPGHWAEGRFTAHRRPLNAVHVMANRTAARGNPVPLFFARILGRPISDVRASAIAVYGSAGASSRFLIDEEMFDTDVPEIEWLAAKLGKKADWLLSDNDGDWFIDLPPGEVLRLPTGQVGDPALFDIQFAEFPFLDRTDPSYEDFLNYNEDSNSWRYDLIDKKMLDPLVGVNAVEDPALYRGFVDPNNCQVSPIYKSDVSDLGDSKVNALGWRRGLLAFKIIAVGQDPDGPGSKLPDLVIQVCPPEFGSLSSVGPWGDERIRLVR